MANLLWKTKKFSNASGVTFPDGGKFEKTVFETPEILSDIFLLKRQVRGGKKFGVSQTSLG